MYCIRVNTHYLDGLDDYDMSGVHEGLDWCLWWLQQHRGSESYFEKCWAMIVSPNADEALNDDF
jgi:hypothetical protein